MTAVIGTPSGPRSKLSVVVTLPTGPAKETIPVAVMLYVPGPNVPRLVPPKTAGSIFGNIVSADSAPEKMVRNAAKIRPVEFLVFTLLPSLVEKLIRTEMNRQAEAKTRVLIYRCNI